MPLSRLASFIDHTVLKPEATAADVERLCDEAREYRFFAVCVNPVFVRLAAERLAGSPVKVCSVIGFPLGAQPTPTKVFEARQAIADGATEIDTVIHVGALKAGDRASVLEDVRAVANACHEGGAILKVIIEAALLTDDEKVAACQICMDAGADFVKTSTGFGPSGATPADVSLMSRTVAPKKLGVKAAGGVRSYAELLQMVDAGATRVGSSSGVRIISEAKALGAR